MGSSFDVPQLQQDIEKTIVNKTLRKSLLEHLEQGRLASVLQELEFYYPLILDYLPGADTNIYPAESFAINTLSYLQRHPQKPNWPLRLILKTEGIDPAIKAEIRTIISHGVKSFVQEDRALQVLQTAYNEYHRVLKESAPSDDVQATVAIYKYMVEELEALIRRKL